MGKNENEGDKRGLVFKEDGQEYAQVAKMLGNGRLEAVCFDGVKRLCHIRGKLRKKVWINQADIILKYSADEARNLKSYGEFPESIKIMDTFAFVEEDLDEDIEFDDVDSDDSGGEDRDDIDDI